MKKISCLILVFIMTLMSFTYVVSAEAFTDCKKSDWYYDSVQFAQEKGWINGFEDGEIKPQENLTRAEMCAILKSVSQFDFNEWKSEQDFFLDSIVKKHLVKMIENNESECVMYAYGKSDTEAIGRLRQAVKMCFDEYEDKYPYYFKNYSTACGSLSEYEDCIKVYFEMAEK